MENTRHRAFVTAAEEGSFTAAGKIMGYTPSGVSQLVHALEDELGVPLLIRVRNGVILSEDGKRILPYIKSAMAREDAIAEVAANLRGLLIGKIVIASYNSIAANLLPNILKKFSSKYPGVEIKILEGTKDMMEHYINNNMADVAFSSRFENKPEYNWYPFMKDRIVVVIPPDHECAGEEFFPIAKFENEKFIMGSDGNDRDVDDSLRKYGVDPNVVFTTLDNYSAINMVSAGLGISVMNEFITRNWKSDVVIIPIEGFDTVEFGITVPNSELMSPALKCFVDIAYDELSANNCI